MQHGLMYSGAFETNFADLKPGATGFIGSDGANHEHRAWPAEVDGVRIWYMEKPGKHFVAVRLQRGATDIVLPNPLLLDPAAHMGHGKRFSAEPVVIDDEMILVILGDVLRKNPELRNQLATLREGIRAKH